MTRHRWPAAVAAALVAIVLGGCTDDGAGRGSATPSMSSSTQSETPSATSRPRRKTPSASPKDTPPPGLVYYAGRRARTGELQLFAEQTGFTGRTELLAAVRAAMAGPPVDPDYASLWGADVVDSVRLYWDGDEGLYAVRLADDTTSRRPPGMSMREAHLAIQQVVWTLQSVGEIAAPVNFRVGRAGEPVTNLLGVPATGPYDTYLAADDSGVLSSVNILTFEDSSEADRLVEISGVSESFEGTVGVRVVDANGETMHEYSTQATQCCGKLSPFTYTLDTTGWAPGNYTLICSTDDAIGIEHGSDGPEIDTKTLTVR